MHYPTSAQRGAAMLINMALAIFFLLFAFLLIDLLRVERTARTMQLAVDAAALAGAVQLHPLEPVPATPLNPYNLDYPCSVAGGNWNSSSPLCTNPDFMNPADGPQYRAYAGWILAKRAATAFLAANSVYGDTGGYLSGPDRFGELNEESVFDHSYNTAYPKDCDASTDCGNTCNDPYEGNPNSQYRHDLFLIPHYYEKFFTLRIERGLYAQDSGGNYKFFSLECDSPYAYCHVSCYNAAPGKGIGAYHFILCDPRKFPAGSPAQKICYPNATVWYGRPAFDIANTVHVSLTLVSLPTILGNMLRLAGVREISGFSNIMRESVAAPDSH